jgi:predicted DCC family thiol-disulfide oxidoreductase YuxK
VSEPAVILFDGVCNLCDATVRFIAANDPRGNFRFAPLQSAAAVRLLARHGRAPGPPASIVTIDADGVLERSAAALRIARGLRAPWRWLAALAIIPVQLRDPMYGLIARNRYRWFGRRDVCRLPSPELAGRFLSDE